MILPAWLALFLSVAAAPERIPLEHVQAKYGFTRVHDGVTGLEHLRRPGLTLTVAPDLTVVLVNGEPVRLTEPVEMSEGRITVPRELLYFLGAPERLPEAAPLPAAPDRTPRAPDATPRRPKAGFRIVLDPGHGGVHTGGQGDGGLLEKNVNLDVALRLRDLLEKEGVEVVMTRTRDVHFSEDVDEDLHERIRICREAKPDLFLSVHSNWHRTSGPRGFEVYVPRNHPEGRNRALAEAIHDRFRSGLDTEDRGIKEAGFQVIRNADCTAVLVELEFISNPRGERELGDPEHRQKVAGLLADAVRRYREGAGK